MVRLPRGQVWVAGAGKAAVAMAAAAADLLPEARGCVIAPGDGAVAATRRVGRIRVVRGSHPVPDGRSFRATSALLRSLAARPRTDAVLFLLSGGASALLERPAEGLTPADLTRLGAVLLRCGADITLVNAVRKHVSAVKGGGLLRLASPRRVVTLALSDVPGDDLATIGSGPTVGDPSTFEAACAGLEAARAWDDLPRRVQERLQAGRRGELPETVEPGSRLARRSPAAVIGSNRLALRAAAREARRRGYRVRTLRRPLAGEASAESQRFCAALPDVGEPTCVLAGGETTVRVGTAAGRGGRNQELALASVVPLAGRPWSLLAAGTDGVDGPTPAAGGFADGTSLRRAGRRRLERALAEHDSHPLLSSLGDTLVTGPTGTNVMDLLLAVRRP